MLQENFNIVRARYDGRLKAIVHWQEGVPPEPPDHDLLRIAENHGVRLLWTDLLIPDPSDSRPFDPRASAACATRRKSRVNAEFLV
jgi:hypothetical protein